MGELLHALVAIYRIGEWYEERVFIKTYSVRGQRVLLAIVTLDDAHHTAYSKVSGSALDNT